jgi:hypothetical protein
MSMVNQKKAKVHGEGNNWEGKGMASNGNGLGVKFKLKKSKARLGSIEVVVHANKMACP